MKYIGAYLYDRLDGSTVLLSTTSTGTQGNDDSVDPSISNDGNFIAFESISTNLGASPSNSQIYIRDVKNGTTQLLSKNASYTGNGFSYTVALSPDASYASFQSTTNIFIPNDANQYQDIYTAKTGF